MIFRPRCKLMETGSSHGERKKNALSSPLSNPSALFGAPQTSRNRPSPFHTFRTSMRQTLERRKLGPLAWLWLRVEVGNLPLAGEHGRGIQSSSPPPLPEFSWRDFNSLEIPHRVRGSSLDVFPHQEAGSCPKPKPPIQLASRAREVDPLFI